jgi:putative transposase
MGHAGVTVAVSDLNKKIYGTIEAWRNRLIDGEHPYVYLDGIVLKRSWAGEVRNVSLLVAIGKNSEGYREILGICEGAKEDMAGWSALLKHLKEHGLKGVRLITSDACIGLAESAAEFFPDAVSQRCIVHWHRNVLSHVPSTKVREIAAMLKAIHASEGAVAAREKSIRVIEKLQAPRLTRAAELAEVAVEETLTYYAFPEEHWRRIRTNNPLQRVLREIRQRTRVVGAFPDGNLAAARLRHVAGTDRAAEGPADERCHHRLSQCRAPLGPNQKCEKLWTTLPLASTPPAVCCGLIEGREASLA